MTNQSFGFFCISMKAFIVYKSYLFMNYIYRQAYSTIYFGTPDFWAKVRACKTICPLFIPSMANALKAAKF